MNSLVILCTAVLCCGSAYGAFVDFYVPQITRRNEFILECYVRGVLQAESRFYFYAGLGQVVPTSTRTLSAGSRTLAYTVDPNSLIFVRCFYGGDISNILAISGLPTTPSSSPETVSVYRGDEVTLICPYDYKKSRGILDPLEVSWWLNEGRGTQRIQTNTSSHQVSSDGQILRVTASHDQALYLCRLQISRCTRFNEINLVHSRCSVESTNYIGLQTRFNLLERIHVIVTPESQNVFVGERANFTCSGSGSYVNIMWRFNDTLLNCTVKKCTFNAIPISQELKMVTGGVKNVTTTSLLEVDTADIFFNLEATKLDIQCIVTQILPQNLTRQGGTNSIRSYSSTLTIMKRASTTTMAIMDTTTLSPTTLSPTTLSPTTLSLTTLSTTTLSTTTLSPTTLSTTTLTTTEEASTTTMTITEGASTSFTTKNSLELTIAGGPSMDGLVPTSRSTSNRILWPLIIIVIIVILGIIIIGGVIFMYLVFVRKWFGWFGVSDDSDLGKETSRDQDSDSNASSFYLIMV